MAIASFNVLKCTSSASGSQVNSLGNPCFLSENVHTSDATLYPLSIPTGSNNNNSYEVWLRLKCAVAPDNACYNFKVWGPNSQPVEGATIYIGATSQFTNLPVNSSSLIATARQDTNYYSNNNSLLYDAVTTVTAQNETTNYFVLQLRVDSSASKSQGNAPAVLFNHSYDEY